MLPFSTPLTLSPAQLGQDLAGPLRDSATSPLVVSGPCVRVVRLGSVPRVIFSGPKGSSLNGFRFRATGTSLLRI